MRKLTALVLSLILVTPVYAGEAPFVGYNSYYGYTSATIDYGNVFDAVYVAKEEGYVSGYDDGTFRASTEVNRAELAKILSLAAGVSEEELHAQVDEFIESGSAGFTDVDPADRDELWYVDYVLYAQAEGIVSGYPDGSYKPSDPVLNVELMKMAVESQYGTPSDEYAGSEWYDLYKNFLFDMNVLRGSSYSSSTDHYYFSYNFEAKLGFTSDPESKSLREGVVELIYRLHQIGEGEPYSGLISFNEYVEQNEVEVTWEEGLLSLSDPTFAYEFYDLPTGDLNAEELYVEIFNEYGHNNGYSTRLTFVLFNEYYQSTYSYEDDHTTHPFRITVYDPDSYWSQNYDYDVSFQCFDYGTYGSDAFAYEQAIGEVLCYDDTEVIKADIGLTLL